MRGSNQLSLEQPENKAGAFYTSKFAQLPCTCLNICFASPRVCAFDDGQGGQLGSSGFDVAYDFRCVHPHLLGLYSPADFFCHPPGQVLPAVP